MFLKNRENKKYKYKCSSREEGLNKLWYIDITEYFILIKKNEIFLFAIAGNNFKAYIVQGQNNR